MVNSSRERSIPEYLSNQCGSSAKAPCVDMRHGLASRINKVARSGMILTLQALLEGGVDLEWSSHTPPSCDSMLKRK
jgi:hypothetical protein